MRPLLASLALLLLALSRQSAGISWKIECIKQESSTTTSSVSFISKEEKVKVVQTMKANGKQYNHGGEPSEEQLKALFELLGNTMFSAALGATGGSLQRVPYLAAALINGILCEASDPVVAKKLNKVVYGSEELSGASKTKEVEDAKSSGLDCSKAPTEENKIPFACYCTQGKTLFACGLETLVQALEAKGYSLANKKMCRGQAVANLLNAGSKVLGKEYDLDSFGKNGFDDAFGGNVDGMTGKESDKMKDLFCDATDPAVEKAVRDVYAADGLYWITESVLYALIFGEPDQSLSEVCEQEEFKSEFGKCVCKQDTGFTFCIYKVLSEFFQKEKYLDCTPAAKKFVPEHKPAKLPHLAQRKKKSAATAFSLLAPLTAAAAMLLRQ